MNKLQELALENGCDVLDWPADDQRAAIVELFEQDEARTAPGKYPDWIGDCLSERVTCNETARREIISILQIDDEGARHNLLGRLIEEALLTYPLDSLAVKCVENIHAWRAEQRQCEAEDAADRAREKQPTKVAGRVGIAAPEPSYEVEFGE
jgi:hypothetical protein